MNLGGIIAELQKKGYIVTPVVSKSIPLIKAELLNWQVYKNSKNNFSVEFPGEVKTETKTDGAEHVKHYTYWQSQKNPGIFTMGVEEMEIPEKKTAEYFFTHLEKQKDAQVERLTFNGMKAMKASMSMNFIVSVRMQIYLIEDPAGKHLYKLMAMYPKDQQGAEAAERFLNSFKQIK